MSDRKIRTVIDSEVRFQLQESQKLGALGTFGLLVQAAAIGCITGLVIGAFRMLFNCLNHLSSDSLRGVLPHETLAGMLPAYGVIFLLFLLSVLFLRIEPMVSGSGIPQVELAQKGKYPPMNWFRVLAVKFLATLASLAAGLSVGRQGPSVQMGAAVGIGVGTMLHGRHAQSMHRYLTGGAVAGMTAAFSSPVAGLFFAIEDMQVVLDRRMLVFLTVASASAFFSVYGILGIPLLYPFQNTAFPEFAESAALAAVMAIAGICGSLYTRIMVGLILAEDRIRWKRPWIRTLLPFLLSGFLITVYPAVITGLGPAPLELENTSLAFSAVLMLFAVKVLFSAASFASCVSGGILTPMLTMGAMLGSCCFIAGNSLGIFTAGISGTVIAVAMAGFFAGVARTPVTAAALLIETTCAWNAAPFILLAAFAGHWIAGLLGTRPVYSYLRERILKQQETVSGST